MSNGHSLPAGINNTRFIEQNDLLLLQPDWPVASHVKALCTTRIGGSSTGAYTSFNLASHVEDDAQTVAKNRSALSTAFDLQYPPHWLKQVHSDKSIVLPTSETSLQADASYTSQSDTVCAVLTADCLPVLISNREGTWVAAVHAGWRGLASQIISKTIANYIHGNDQLVFWFGPAISAKHYEVDSAVYNTFVEMDSAYQTAFTAGRTGHYFFDVYQAARVELGTAGINTSQIFGGGACSYREADLFYSYRRDGAQTGRMASLIWIDEV